MDWAGQQKSSAVPRILGPSTCGVLGGRVGHQNLGTGFITGRVNVDPGCLDRMVGNDQGLSSSITVQTDRMLKLPLSVFLGGD